MSLKQILTEANPVNEYDITVKDLIVLETLTVVNSIVTTDIKTDTLEVKKITIDKNAVGKSWNPAVSDTIDTGSSTSVQLKITFNTTALTMGLVSSKLTVTNSSITANSQISNDLTDYSGLPSAYDGLTACADPIQWVSGVRNGAFDLQILSNGYANMNIGDTVIFSFTVL